MKLIVSALACLMAVSAMAVGQTGQRGGSGYGGVASGGGFNWTPGVDKFEIFKREEQLRLEREENRLAIQKRMIEQQVKTALLSVLQNEVILMQALIQPVDVFVIGLPGCTVKISIKTEVIETPGPSGTTISGSSSCPDVQSVPLFVQPKMPDLVRVPPVTSAEKQRAHQGANQAIKGISLGGF